MVQAHVVRHIFVTGGVASSLGKGLTASSLGMLAEGAWAARHHAEARPVSERRSRHHEPVPARRGLRHRRRCRDRPRRRPLRALPVRRSAWTRPMSRPGRSTAPSSPASVAAATSGRRSRSSRTSPTRSRPGSARWPPTTSTASSPRSAARSATSSRSLFWRRSARSASRSDAKIACSSTSAWCPTSRRQGS